MNPTPWTPERIALWRVMRGKRISARVAHERLNALPGPPISTPQCLVSFAKDNRWPAVPRAPARIVEQSDNRDGAKLRQAIRDASRRFGAALAECQQRQQAKETSPCSS